MKSLLKEVIFVILLAGFGGFVRTLAGKRREDKYNWRIAIAEIVIAVFAGLLTHWLLADCQSISDNFRAVGVALSGYSARGVLNVFNVIFLERLKKF